MNPTVEDIASRIIVKCSRTNIAGIKDEHTNSIALFGHDVLYAIAEELQAQDCMSVDAAGFNPHMLLYAIREAFNNHIAEEDTTPQSHPSASLLADIGKNEEIGAEGILYVHKHISVYTNRKDAWRYCYIMHDKIVSCVHIQQYKGLAFINDIYTHTGYRNRGYMQTLLKQIAVDFEDVGLPTIVADPDVCSFTDTMVASGVFYDSNISYHSREELKGMDRD